MRMDYLSKVGNDLVERFKTRDPFLIAEGLGVEVLFCGDFGPLKGMYRVIRRNRFIFINKDLAPRMQSIVCAHELGHDQLHRHLAKGNALQEFMLYDMTTKSEYMSSSYPALLIYSSPLILSCWSQALRSLTVVTARMI